MRAAAAPLPHSEETEAAVLAAVLVEPSLLAVVTERLVVEDFYLERHQLLLEAFLALQAQDSPIDLRTVQAQMEARGVLARCNGLAWLATLDQSLPDLSRVAVYAGVVRERSLRRRLMEVCQRGLQDCRDGGLPAPEALAAVEQGVLALALGLPGAGMRGLRAVLEESVAELEEHPGGLPGLATGFRELDALTGGLQPGHLVIVAGRPGMGKTSLALNMAHQVARNGGGVGVFSLEMSEAELSHRLLTAEAGVGFTRLRSGLMSHGEWDRVHAAQKRLSALPLWIDDAPSPTLLELASRARRLRQREGLALLVVDYLQLMTEPGHENRQLEVAALTRGLKRLAKELGVPVVCLSQLSRNPERRSGDHRPQLADLRESGAIEQDADLVVFVFREEVYAPEDPTKHGRAELIVAKNRNGGPGTVRLTFIGQTTSFKNRPEGSE